MRFMSGLYITSFQVKTTSAAVSGRPSLQRTPARSLNVQVNPSGETAHDSAKAGRASCVAASSEINPAKIRRTTSSDAGSIASNGLKVRGAPAASSVRRPPGNPGSPFSTNGDGSGWPEAAGAGGVAGFPQPTTKASRATATGREKRCAFIRSILDNEIPETRQDTRSSVPQNALPPAPAIRIFRIQ